MGICAASSGFCIPGDEVRTVLEGGLEKLDRSMSNLLHALPDSLIHTHRLESRTSGQ